MQILLRVFSFGFVFFFYCCTEAVFPQNTYNKLCALQEYSCEHTELAVFMYTEVNKF